MSIRQKLEDIFESSLPEKLADYLDKDVNSIRKHIQKLSFAEYMKLATAVEEFDDSTISQYVPEADNPYAKPDQPRKPTKPVGPANSSTNALNLDIKDNDGKVDTTITSLDTKQNTADIIDDSGRKRTVNIDDLEDEIESDINEMRKLSGMDPVSETECKTCGDEETVYWDQDDHEVGAIVKASAPCPDCSVNETTTAGAIATAPTQVTNKRRNIRRSR